MARQASTGSEEFVAVTFDATGTLFSSPDLGAIYSRVLGRHGIGADPERMVAAVRWTWREFDCRVRMGEDRFRTHTEGARGWWLEFVRRVCEHLEEPRPSRFAAAELFETFGRAGAWRVYPEVVPTLERLRGSGLSLAVVSNWDERLPLLLERLGLASFFDFVAVSSIVGVEKPHPLIFQEVLRELGVPPERALHVGDKVREDAEGALAVGMSSIVLDRGGRRAGAADLGAVLRRVGIAA